MEKSSDSIWSCIGEIYRKEISETPFEGTRERTDSFIRVKFLDYVWNEMKTNDELKPPFIREPTESRFLRSRKVTRVLESTMVHNGLLVPGQEGFVIQVKRDLSRRRTRTAIAHEIGHTYFFDLTQSPPNEFPYFKYAIKDKWAVEGVAFEIARQILAPSDWLKEACYKPSLRVFQECCKTFDITSSILARRIFHDLGLWNALLFYCGFSADGKIGNPKSVFKGRGFKSFDLNSNFRMLSLFIQGRLPADDEEITRNEINLGRKSLNLEMSRIEGSNPRVACLLFPLQH